MTNSTKQLIELLKEGGGGDGGGDGGFSGTVATTDSGTFTPTYGGGKKKEKEDDSPNSFAKQLIAWAREEIHKEMWMPDSGMAGLDQSPKKLGREDATHSADVGGTKKDNASGPEPPFDKDPVLDWERVFQKMEGDEDINLSTKLIVSDSNNKVLIMKDAYSDFWDLPGGHIHDGETPEEGVVREVYEEAGMEFDPDDLDQIFARELALGQPPEPRVVLFFHTHIDVDEPKPRLSEEHTEFAWVDAIDAMYYNLGVFGPIVRYVNRFIIGEQEEDNPYIDRPDANDIVAALHGKVVHTHDDGDLTVEANGKNYVVTTDGKVFEEINPPKDE